MSDGRSVAGPPRKRGWVREEGAEGESALGLEAAVAQLSAEIENIARIKLQRGDSCDRICHACVSKSESCLADLDSWFLTFGPSRTGVVAAREPDVSPVPFGVIRTHGVLRSLRAIRVT